MTTTQIQEAVYHIKENVYGLEDNPEIEVIDKNNILIKWESENIEWVSTLQETNKADITLACYPQNIYLISIYS